MRSPRTVSSAASASISIDHLGAEAAAPLAGAARVEAQARLSHDERVLRLERLDLRDHRAPAEEVAAGRVGPVDAVAPADAAEVVEQVHPRSPSSPTPVSE